MLEERMWSRDIAIDQVFIERTRTDFARNTRFKQRFDLGAKNEPLAVPIVMERLFAKAIARGEKALASAVPEGECKHTAQLFHAVVAVLFVGVNDRFRVAIRRKGVPALLQAFL